jgi:malate synthase
MRGDLKSKFEKDGKLYERKLNPNRSYISRDGKGLKLHGRSLLLGKKCWAFNDKPIHYFK